MARELLGISGAPEEVAHSLLAPILAGDPRLEDAGASGWRLSCQARVYRDTVCLVPELQRVPRAATMGVNRLVLLDPNVRKVYVELA